MPAISVSYRLYHLEETCLESRAENKISWQTVKIIWLNNESPNITKLRTNGADRYKHVTKDKIEQEMAKVWNAPPMDRTLRGRPSSPSGQEEGRSELRTTLRSQRCYLSSLRFAYDQGLNDDVTGQRRDGQCRLIAALPQRCFTLARSESKGEALSAKGLYL
uniref:Uncharacterized protein n=1 Tax=Steinernema glaseri TaxID=37863 RepID=A0A1I7YEQ4_9BILA